MINMQKAIQPSRPLSKIASNYMFDSIGSDPFSLVMLTNYEILNNKIKRSQIVIFVSTPYFNALNLYTIMKQAKIMECMHCTILQLNVISMLVKDSREKGKGVQIVSFWEQEEKVLKAMLKVGDDPDITFTNISNILKITNQFPIHPISYLSKKHLSDLKKWFRDRNETVKLRNFRPYEAQNRKKMNSILAATKNCKSEYRNQTKNFASIARYLIQKEKENTDDQEIKTGTVDWFQSQYGQFKMSLEALFHLYSEDNFFHKLINNFLRCSSSSTDLFYTMPFIATINESIRDIYLKKPKQLKNKNYKILYRGCYLSQTEIQYLHSNVGKHIQFFGFLSTTAHEDVANHFVKNALITIQINSAYQTNQAEYEGYALVSQYSQFQYEQEVLFNVNSVFKIESIKEIIVQKKSAWRVKLLYEPGMNKVSSQLGKQIQCQGDIFDDPQAGPKQLAQAAIYWRKFNSILINLSGHKKKLLFQRITTFFKIVRMLVRTNRRMELVDELITLLRFLIQKGMFHISKIIEQMGIKLLSSDLSNGFDGDNVESFIRQRLEQVLRGIFVEEIKQNCNFINEVSKFLLKYGKKKQQQVFTQEMTKYFLQILNNFACFRIQNQYIFKFLPNRPQTLTMLKNPKLIKQKILNSLYSQTIVGLNHKPLDLQMYCSNVDFNDLKFTMVKSIKQLSSKLKSERYGVISCTDLQQFVGILQSKIMREPGSMKILFFLGFKTKDYQQKQMASDYFQARFMQKQVILIIGKNFQLPKQELPLQRFLFSSHQQSLNSLSLDFQLIMSVMANQNTNNMAILYELQQLIKYLVSETEVLVKDIQQLLKKVQWSKPVLEYILGTNIVDRWRDLLEMEQDPAIQIYNQQVIAKLIQQINKKSMAGAYKEKRIYYKTYLKLSKQQETQLKLSIGQIIRNKNILICQQENSQSQNTKRQNNLNQSHDVIIQLPPRKKRRYLQHVGNYAIQGSNLIFAPMCGFRVMNVNSGIVILTYVDSEQMYCIPHRDQQPIFTTNNFKNKRWEYEKIERGLQNCRASTAKSQGQIYLNMIPNAQNKHLLHEGQKYWQYMYDLCWIQYNKQQAPNETNKKNKKKLLAQLIQAINAEIQLSLILQANTKIMLEKVFELCTRLNLTKLMEDAIKNERQEDSRTLIYQLTNLIILAYSLIQSNHQQQLHTNTTTITTTNTTTNGLLIILSCIVSAMQDISHKLKFYKDNRPSSLLIVVRGLRRWVFMDKSRYYTRSQEIYERYILLQVVRVSRKIIVSSQQYNYYQQYPPLYPKIIKQSSNNNHNQDHNYNHNQQQQQQQQQQQLLIQLCPEFCPQAQNDQDTDQQLNYDQNNKKNNGKQYNFMDETIDWIHLRIVVSMLKMIHIITMTHVEKVQVHVEHNQKDKKLEEQYEMQQLNQSNVKKGKNTTEQQTGDITQPTTILNNQDDNQSIAQLLQGMQSQHDQKIEQLQYEQQVQQDGQQVLEQYYRRVYIIWQYLLYSYNKFHSSLHPNHQPLLIPSMLPYFNPSPNLYAQKYIQQADAILYILNTLPQLYENQNQNQKWEGKLTIQSHVITIKKLWDQWKNCGAEGQIKQVGELVDQIVGAIYEYRAQQNRNLS